MLLTIGSARMVSDVLDD